MDKRLLKGFSPQKPFKQKRSFPIRFYLGLLTIGLLFGAVTGYALSVGLYTDSNDSVDNATLWQPEHIFQTATEKEKAKTSTQETELDWDALMELDLETGKASEKLNQLIGKRVKVPGFAVILDGEDFNNISDILLVPAFGYCIHIPPPPANQMVYGKLDKNVGYEVLDGPIWLIGDFHIKSTDSIYGAAGFTMENITIEPYEWEPPEAIKDEPIL